MTLPKKDPLPPPPAPPLDEAGFTRLMESLAPWPQPLHAAVAVSGGPDSMALTFFLADWLAARGGRLSAVTIDHRLRAESTEEAQTVHGWLNARGLTHTILAWDHKTPPATGLHARARAARYDLLTGYCRAVGATHLFLAQHADDQAETVLMRLARGSGLDGLAGMPVRREQDGIEHVRPLLPLRKSALVAACTARNWPYVTDPSNSSDRFTRARLRALAGELSREGLTVERLYEVALAAGRARAFLETAANDWLSTHATADPYGVVRMDQAAFRAAPADMRLRVLARILLCLSGDDYAPRQQSLEHLADRLASPTPTLQTLGGVIIDPSPEQVTFLREPATINDTLSLAAFTGTTRWDNRFAIHTVSDFPPNSVIAPLGEISREALEKAGHTAVAALPLRVRSGLPALFHNGRLVALPAFMPESEKAAPLTAAFLPRRQLILKPFQPAGPLQS